MEEGIFNTDFGKKFLALIKAALKVSDLIPDLALRGKIKSQILDVYKIFISAKGGSAFGGNNTYLGFLKEIDILDGYIFLGGHLNLIKEEHCRTLRNGFLIFKSRIVLLVNELPKTIPSEKKEIVKKPEIILSERQGKIMKYFEEHEQSKLAELLEIFPEVSDKTIRNDLLVLAELGKIKREGSMGSGSFYRLVRK